MFDGPCPHGRPSEFDCDRCSYDPKLVTENMVARRLLDDERRANSYLEGRIELLTAALTGLVEMQFPTDGVIHRSSFEHVRREALWENARAALAAESETRDV